MLHGIHQRQVVIHNLSNQAHHEFYFDSVLLRLRFLMMMATSANSSLPRCIEV